MISGVNRLVVYGVQVDIVEAFREDLPIPFGDALWGKTRPRSKTHIEATRDQLDTWVHHLHRMGPSLALLGVVFRLVKADLPRAVH